MSTSMCTTARFVTAEFELGKLHSNVQTYERDVLLDSNTDVQVTQRLAYD